MPIERKLQKRNIEKVYNWNRESFQRCDCFYLSLSRRRNC